MKSWPLAAVLQEKYQYTEADALAFADFVLPMLDFNPIRRATAADCLKHPWLQPDVEERVALEEVAAARAAVAAVAAAGPVGTDVRDRRREGDAETSRATAAASDTAPMDMSPVPPD